MFWGAEYGLPSQMGCSCVSVPGLWCSNFRVVAYLFGFGVKCVGFECQYCHLLNCVASLSFNVVICKMGIIILALQIGDYRR